MNMKTNRSDLTSLQEVKFENIPLRLNSTGYAGQIYAEAQVKRNIFVGF